MWDTACGAVTCVPEQMIMQKFSDVGAKEHNRRCRNSLEPEQESQSTDWALEAWSGPAYVTRVLKKKEIELEQEQEVRAMLRNKCSFRERCSVTRHNAGERIEGQAPLSRDMLA
jgi:hypothetical protein